jgi:hypothetical protein
MTDDLYHRVVSITEEYLGPAAPRFVARQITAHLNKPPQDLSREDLPELVAWAKVTLSLLTDDREVVSQYVYKINQLGAGATAWSDAAPHNP